MERIQHLADASDAFGQILTQAGGLMSGRQALGEVRTLDSPQAATLAEMKRSAETKRLGACLGAVPSKA